MDANSNRDADRSIAAEQLCQRNIDWYEKQKGRARIGYSFFQTAALLLSGLTPVLILWQGVPKFLQALPAALATVATALLGTFRYRDNQGRWAISQLTLEHELFNFKNGIGPNYGAKVDPETALVRFVKTVEEVVITETAQWRRLETSVTPTAKTG